MKRQCLGHTLLFSWEATPLQQSIIIIYKFVSAGLINKKQTNKQADAFRLLNFIFHQLLITYNSITLNFILIFPSFLQHLTCDF